MEKWSTLGLVRVLQGQKAVEVQGIWEKVAVKTSALDEECRQEVGPMFLSVYHLLSVPPVG